MTPAQILSLKAKAEEKYPYKENGPDYFNWVRDDQIKAYMAGYCEAMNDIENPFPSKDPTNEEFAKWVDNMEELQKPENKPENIQDFI